MRLQPPSSLAMWISRLLGAVAAMALAAVVAVALAAVAVVVQAAVFAVAPVVMASPGFPAVALEAEASSTRFCDGVCFQNRNDLRRDTGEDRPSEEDPFGLRLRELRDHVRECLWPAAGLPGFLAGSGKFCVMVGIFARVRPGS